MSYLVIILIRIDGTMQCMLQLLCNPKNVFNIMRKNYIILSIIITDKYYELRWSADHGNAICDCSYTYLYSYKFEVTYCSKANIYLYFILIYLVVKYIVMTNEWSIRILVNYIVSTLVYSKIYK